MHSLAARGPSSPALAPKHRNSSPARPPAAVGGRTNTVLSLLPRQTRPNPPWSLSARNQARLRLQFNRLAGQGSACMAMGQGAIRRNQKSTTALQAAKATPALPITSCASCSMFLSRIGHMLAGDLSEDYLTPSLSTARRMSICVLSSNPSANRCGSIAGGLLTMSYPPVF